MTRKEAILETISIIEEARIHEEKRKDIILKLELCINELPFAKWSEAAIFDACDQFISDNNRNIKSGDFNLSGLPSHPTIKNRFGMTAKEFKEKYYPDLTPATSSPYGNIPTRELISTFKFEFERISPRSSDDYNKKRNHGIPCWFTVARRLGETTWSGLLSSVGLQKCATKKRQETTYLASSHCNTETIISDIENRISKNESN